MTRQGDLFAPAPAVYPQAPGFKKRETSRQAAEGLVLSVANLRDLVLAEIRRRPGTADDIAKRLKIDRLSIRPRLSELSNLGMVFDTGAREENASGKKAIVWALAPGRAA